MTNASCYCIYGVCGVCDHSLFIDYIDGRMESRETHLLQQLACCPHQVLHAWQVQQHPQVTEVFEIEVVLSESAAEEAVLFWKEYFGSLGTIVIDASHMSEVSMLGNGSDARGEMINCLHAKEVTDVSNDLVPNEIQLARLKSKLLFSENVANELTQPLDQRQIMKMIPHRAPFLLVDRVELLNLELRLIKSTRKVDADDPVFQGHFPGNPVYPGVLQQESMFQSALILMYFLLNKTAIPPLDEQVTNAVGTRVYDVFHLAVVRPGDEMTIRCVITEYDSLIVTAIVQITVSDKVVTIGKGEFCVI